MPVNVRASSVPKPSWPVSATVNVQPGPGVPSVAVGTVIETTPGVSPPAPLPAPPAGLSCATETCGAPSDEESPRPAVAVAGVTQSSVPNPSTSISWFQALPDASE